MVYKVNGTLVANEAGYVHESFTQIGGTTQSTQIKITASDAAADDLFGKAVAVGSNRIVVGAYQDDDNGTDSGSAYIFDLNGNQLAKIKASDGAASDFFGKAVAVGCGRICVGAYLDNDTANDSGSVYLFDLDGTQLKKIKPASSTVNTSDYFGFSVAIGSNRIVIGEYNDDPGSVLNAGSAYIYDINGILIKKITASDPEAGDLFGVAVAAGSGRIVVGANGDDDNGSLSGSAYIFDLNGSQIAKIKASDGANNDAFGRSVAVGCGRIVVGSYQDSDNGLFSGSAYIFDLDGTQLAKIKASDGGAYDNFGFSVAVGCDRIVVGADDDDDNGTNSGSVYIFDLDGNQLAKITASDGASTDGFGHSVAVGFDRIVVGSHQDNPASSGSITGYGSAYIYKLSETYDSYIEKVLD
jgi:hypothetical protein